MSNLAELKKKYEELRAQKARAEAQQEMYLEELKKLGCNSIEEAEEKIAELEASLEKTRARVAKQVETIREALGES